MENICKTCFINPLNHSCEIYKENNIFNIYTCPGKSIKYDDSEGIIKHFSTVINTVENHDWMITVDCYDFSYKHAMQIYTAIELIKIILQKNKYLKKINIINSNTFIYITINACLYLLNDNMKALIYIDNKSYI